jgi:uncharacterized membrane protein
MRPPSWMVWNLFLAAIPLALSVWLFRWSSRRSALWWLGVAVFVAFLPNAPYVLSDAIHLVPRLRAETSWRHALVLLAGFGTFFFLGFEAYVLCILNLRDFLHRTVSRWTAVAIELTLHGLSAVGIYLGRVHRFNSWDLLRDTDVILRQAAVQLTRPWPFILVAGTFVVTAGLCEVLLRATRVAVRMLPARNSSES